MRALKTAFLSFVVFHSLLVHAEDGTIYLQPNTTQLFTELYQNYGLLNPPSRTVFEDALYLDQSVPPSQLPLQQSNQAVFDHADEVLREFHTQMGDLELYIDPKKPKPFFYTASGSKHLIVALVYAMVMSEPDKKFLFVQQAPYYSGHPSAVTGIFHYPNARYKAFHDPSEIVPEPGEVLVEFVTSPNNPDGTFRKPLTNAQIIIADLVFASPAFGSDGEGYLQKNLEWIRKARSAGKHVFSFNSASKQFGKTGARCGYIWYPSYDPYAASIFKQFFGFISASTVAAGTTGLAEFLNLIKALLANPDAGKILRIHAHKSLVMRHQLLEKEFLKRYPGSTVISIPGSPTFFAKLKDPRIPSMNAFEVILKDLNATVNQGEPMGETSEFLRLNLSGYSQLVVEVLNRLAGQQKYTVKDVLVTSGTHCKLTQVCGNGPSSTFYFVRPGDCMIEVDALKGHVEVILPPFIDYLSTHVLTVKKVDSSSNPVVIKSPGTFTQTLKKTESLDVQWTQPLYLDGRWEVIH
jgi:aspartate/methionine/tyrosine aminotransferase